MSWKIEEGVVTWATFDWGDGNDPAQLSAINYHIVQALFDDLKGESYNHAIEIGCGYGRMTPWLSEFADDVTGIEPNDEMRRYVEEYYPDIETLSDKAQNISVSDDKYDLVFTRSVLQHVPPDSIRDVTAEIDRVATDDATLLVCEATKGSPDDKTFWPRSVDRYESLFEGFELLESYRRETHAKIREHTKSRMLFSKE